MPLIHVFHRGIWFFEFFPPFRFLLEKENACWTIISHGRFVIYPDGKVIPTRLVRAPTTLSSLLLLLLLNTCQKRRQVKEYPILMREMTTLSSCFVYCAKDNRRHVSVARRILLLIWTLKLLIVVTVFN